MGLFSRYSVSILNREWQTIMSVVKVKHIPRSNEVIYLTDGNYYRVINVVHNIDKKHGIFLIVEIIGEDPKEGISE